MNISESLFFRQKGKRETKKEKESLGPVYLSECASTWLR